MDKLRINLLGGLEITGGCRVGAPVLNRKAKALVAYLALQNGRPQSREKLAALLWQDSPEQQARTNLRQALSSIRKVLLAHKAAHLVTDRNQIALAGRDIDLDVTLFEKLVAEATLDALERAAALYKGDLLDGFSLKEDAFEAWMRAERERLRHLACDALTKLVAHFDDVGDAERCVEAATRLLTLDPLREAGHRVLMRTYAAQGRHASALKQFEICRAMLKRELAVEPEPETIILYQSIRKQRAVAPGGDTDLTTKLEAVGPALPDGPSIAVLPFVNLSGDSGQDYFADGMVEDIITALSRFRNLFVIARDSSFTYKGKVLRVQAVGRELGVRYVLEGSVRKAGNKVRISGQLIDAATGANLWADRFDGTLEDVFDLQDHVTASVVGAIAPRLERAEIERVKSKRTQSYGAYDYYLRGMAAFHSWSREGNDEALSMFGRAIGLDPGFAAAYGMAARCYSQRKVSGWVVAGADETREAERLACRAVELGKDDALALATAGIALAYVVGDWNSGATFIDQALALNPNLAWAWAFSGYVNIWNGEPEAAIERITRAMRLSPQDSQFFNMQFVNALAHFIAGRYAEASSWAERAVRGHPNYGLAASTFAASAALAGQVAEAETAMAHLRRREPQLRISDLLAVTPFRRPEDRLIWIEGLRTAGLPE